MPMGKGMSKSDFDGIKYMLNQGMKIKDVAEISGYCGRTVYRVRDCAEYDDYITLRDDLTAKRTTAKRKARGTPAEQTNQHENIFDVLMLIATKQDSIINRLDALIQKWE